MAMTTSGNGTRPWFFVSTGRARGWLAALVLAAASVVVPAVTAGVAVGDPCSDVQVVFARGTNEPPGVGVTGEAFTDALTARLPGKSVDIYPVDYPASYDFSRAADGVADAGNKITSVEAACPRTRIVVGGYSQGAAIAAYITTDKVPDGYALPPGINGPLPPSVANHVSTVALFGKPSNGFLDLIDRNAPPITIGHLYANKTIDLCAPSDPVCSSSGFSRAAHSSYPSNGMTDQAADFAAKAIKTGA
jgi:cutinase